MTIIEIIKKLVDLTVFTRRDNMHIRIGDNFHRITKVDYYGTPGWVVFECEKLPYFTAKKEGTPHEKT